MNDLKAIHNAAHFIKSFSYVVPDEDNERFESNSQRVFSSVLSITGCA